MKVRSRVLQWFSRYLVWSTKVSEAQLDIDQMSGLFQGSPEMNEQIS